MESSQSLLLDLPLELRLNIYDFALASSDTLTISTAVLEPPPKKPSTEPLHEAEIPGLPADRVPLVRDHYDPLVLSIFNPPIIPRAASHSKKELSFTDSGFFDATEEEEEIEEPEYEIPILPYPTPLALLQTCHQMYDELEYHHYRRRGSPTEGASDDPNTKPQSRSSQIHKGLSLYVSYPYGMLVLRHKYPHLLRHAREIHICGYFASHEEDPYDLEIGTPLGDEPEETMELAHSVLTDLVSQVFSERASSMLQELHLRIFYPYSSISKCVLQDEFSPVYASLPHIFNAQIDLQIWRASHCTGLDMKARPVTSGRTLRSVWRTLKDDKQHTDPFVIDPDWPKKEEPGKEDEATS